MAEENIENDVVEELPEVDEPTSGEDIVDEEPTIQDEIFNELKTELGNDFDFDEDALLVKVKGAIREVKQKRNYLATNYTDEQIEEDLYNFYSNIINLARYDYNMIGAEGETSHTENGLSRSYVDRKTFFNGVIPFCRVV